MTLQQLRYVVALAEARSFSSAARRLGVSQSTLSLQVAKLERELGVPLFDRRRRRVVLTVLGRALLERARLVLREADGLRSLVGEHARDPMEATVRLGVIPTVAPYLFPPVLRVLHTLHPKLRLLLHEARTDDLLEQLRLGRIDAAILSPPIALSGLRLRVLYREPFLAALPSGSPLARKRRLTLEDLEHERLLLLEEGHCLRRQVLAACRRRRAINEEIQGTSLEMLRAMVALGIGVTLVPALAAGSGPAVEGFRETIVLRCLEPPAPERVIALVWRSRDPHEATLEGFARSLIAHLPKGVAQPEH